jgi:hypothetical protein
VVNIAHPPNIRVRFGGARLSTTPGGCSIIPGLHLFGGSIVPRAIGLNPSKTIAALAERGVGLLMKK